MRCSRHVLLIPTVVMIAACATGGFRQVSITAGDDSQSAAPLEGRSLFVVPNSQMQDTMLEARIRARIEDVLLAKGYTLVSAPRADVYVMASFGAVDRLALSSVSILTPAATRSDTLPNGAVVKKFYPEHMEHPEILSLKNSLSVLVSASDAKLFRETGQVNTIWKGEASTPGKPEMLHQMVPYLLATTLNYFGKSSGGLRSVDVRDTEIKSWQVAK